MFWGKRLILELKLGIHKMRLEYPVATSSEEVLYN